MIFIITECSFRKRKRGKKLLISVLCVFLSALFIVLYLNRTLDPLVCDAATPRLRAEMTRVINEAVSEAMSDYDEKLINITYGSSGKILSVETDSVKINLLRALVTEKINDIREQSGSAVTYNNSSYNFYSSGESVTAQLEAARNAETINRLRG